jgi:hypothetical protein
LKPRRPLAPSEVHTTCLPCNLDRASHYYSHPGVVGPCRSCNRPPEPVLAARRRRARSYPPPHHRPDSQVSSQCPLIVKRDPHCVLVLNSSAFLRLIARVVVSCRFATRATRCDHGGGSPGCAEGHGLTWTILASGLGQVRGVLGRIRPIGRFTFFPISIID